MRFRSTVAFIFTLLISLSSLSSSTTSAGVIEYDFAGTIYDGGSIGSRFTGTVSYDPSEATLIPPTFYWPYQSAYTLGPSSNLTVSVDGGTTYSTQGDLEMGLSMYPANFSGLGGPESTNVSIGVSDVVDRTTPFLVLHNNSRMILPNLSLPSSLGLSDFSDGEFVLSKNPGGVNLWSGSLDSLTVVPEPTCTSVVCVLLAGSFAYRRRRQGQ